jgi:Tfp pilus assembly protein PilO
MNETQTREKLRKLKEQRENIDEQIDELEESLPSTTKVRGDPIVEFH